MFDICNKTKNSVLLNQQEKRVTSEEFYNQENKQSLKSKKKVVNSKHKNSKTNHRLKVKQNTLALRCKLSAVLYFH